MTKNSFFSEHTNLRAIKDGAVVPNHNLRMSMPPVRKAGSAKIVVTTTSVKNDSQTSNAASSKQK